MLGRIAKKGPIDLKFDTSSDNLACFINKKSKLPVESEKNDRKSKSTKKRPKSIKSKAFAFKNQDFLQSILVNVFPQQFAGREDIKKLVKNLQICTEEEQWQDPKSIQNKQKICKDFHKNQIIQQEQDQKIVLSSWVDLIDELAVQSTRVGTQSNYKQSSFSQSSFSEQLNLPYQTPYLGTQFGQNYDQNFDPNYFVYQQYMSNQTPERKKKTSYNEQNKQFKIQLDKVQSDGRTTLMIRNIPNKYTQDLLLEQFNKNYKVKFDFFYLPIDYNNACNVGYAFINFIHAKFIPSFYNQFNGKKWNRFNSEKICCLTYARLQGTGALRNHFKNSHVMQQKDKRFRPLLNQLDEEQRSSLSKIVQGQQQNM